MHYAYYNTGDIVTGMDLEDMKNFKAYYGIRITESSIEVPGEGQVDLSTRVWTRDKKVDKRVAELRGMLSHGDATIDDILEMRALRVITEREFQTMMAFEFNRYSRYMH